MNYYTLLIVLAGFILFFNISCLPNLFFIISKDIPVSTHSSSSSRNLYDIKSIDILPPYTPPTSTIEISDTEDMPPSYELTVHPIINDNDNNDTISNENINNTPSMPPPVYIDIREHIIETSRL